MAMKRHLRGPRLATALRILSPNVAQGSVVRAPCLHATCVPARCPPLTRVMGLATWWPALGHIGISGAPCRTLLTSHVPYGYFTNVVYLVFAH